MSHLDLSQQTELFGTTIKCIPNRAKAIGWNPKKMTVDMIATIEKEVETLLEDGYAPSLSDSLQKLFVHTTNAILYPEKMVVSHL